MLSEGALASKSVTGTYAVQAASVEAEVQRRWEELRRRTVVGPLKRSQACMEQARRLERVRGDSSLPAYTKWNESRAMYIVTARTQNGTRLTANCRMLDQAVIMSNAAGSWIVNGRGLLAVGLPEDFDTPAYVQASATPKDESAHCEKQAKSERCSDILYLGNVAALCSHARKHHTVGGMSTQAVRRWIRANRDVLPESLKERDFGNGAEDLQVCHLSL